MTDPTSHTQPDMQIITERNQDPHDFIATEVSYLIRSSKYDSERPYDLQYDPGPHFPSTNMTNEPKSISVRNFRPFQSPDNFTERGFSIENIDCPLGAAEFHEEERVRKLYYPAVLHVLRRKFPDAFDIRILEHAIRERSVVKETFGLLQPTRIVHVGRSHKRLCRAGNLLKEGRLLACVSNSNSTCGFPHGAVAVPEAANRKVRFTPVACLDGAHTEKCSLWKSFQGPGNDWPLALCDGNTIHGEDSIAADVVFPNRFTENLRFYHNPSHKWFYVKDLAEDEVIVLRQTDSDMEGGGGVAHTSFYNLHAAKDAAPRASIELRAFVFFASKTD